MTPSGSLAPVSASMSDPANEIIRKRPSLQETPVEKPDDLEKLASYLSDKKSAAPEAPAEEIKKGGTPDFDIDNTIQWVGRTI
jgi:hypothetical protein